MKNEPGAARRADMVDWKVDTTLSHAGRDPHAYHGFINTPVVRASTVLFKDTDAMLGRGGSRYSYGLTNTPTIEALTEALTLLEGAAGTVLVPSGLAAATVAILAAARPGTEILIPDNVYGPTRRFCDESLQAFGMRPRYYDPMAAEGIAGLIDNVSAVLIEAPGSQTFEVPDIPALVATAKAAGAITMMDNTWATPLIFRPVQHGIDMVIHAGTKYMGGHSDLLIGSISAGEAFWPQLVRLHKNLGIQAGTEEIWLTLRGLRTMSLRLQRHEASALYIAHWLAKRPEVIRVLHPALPDCPGHANWARDFGRSASLFGFVLDTQHQQACAFLDALTIFGLGYSWGGFESLAILAELQHSRSVKPWTEGPVIRLHIGLEDPADLITDLERGFAALSQP